MGRDCHGRPIKTPETVRERSKLSHLNARYTTDLKRRVVRVRSGIFKRTRTLSDIYAAGPAAPRGHLASSPPPPQQEGADNQPRSCPGTPGPSAAAENPLGRGRALRPPRGGAALPLQTRGGTGGFLHRGFPPPGNPRGGGKHLGGRRGRGWGPPRPAPPPPWQRPRSRSRPRARLPRRGCPVRSAAGSARLRQDEEASSSSLRAGHLQPPLREAPSQPRRRFPLRHQPALDPHAGGDLGQRGWHRSVAAWPPPLLRAVPPPPCPSRPAGEPRRGRWELRARPGGRGPRGAAVVYRAPGWETAGGVREGKGPAGCGSRAESRRARGPEEEGGGAGTARGSPRDRAPLREAKLLAEAGCRGAGKLPGSLPGALSHATVDRRLPGFWLLAGKPVSRRGVCEGGSGGWRSPQDFFGFLCGFNCNAVPWGLM